MKDCDVDPFSLRCRVCGQSVSSANVRRNCRPALTPSSGLGDYVAAGLAAVGITKERVAAVIGSPCRCGERQAALNAAGAKYLGLPAGSTAPPAVDSGD